MKRRLLILEMLLAVAIVVAAKYFGLLPGPISLGGQVISVVVLRA